jgi:prophage regulatory protein
MQRVIRANDIQAVIGLTRRTADMLEAAGKFPRKIRLGANSVGWLVEDIDRWLSDRAAARDGQPPKAA